MVAYRFCCTSWPRCRLNSRCRWQHGWRVWSEPSQCLLWGALPSGPPTGARAPVFRTLPEVAPRNRTCQIKATHYGLLVSLLLNDRMKWERSGKPGVRESSVGACPGTLLVERRSLGAYLHGPREAGNPRPLAQLDRSHWQPRIDANFWSSGRSPMRLASALDHLAERLPAANIKCYLADN